HHPGNGHRGKGQHKPGQGGQRRDGHANGASQPKGQRNRPAGDRPQQNGGPRVQNQGDKPATGESKPLHETAQHASEIPPVE
ncbi:MAG TPA: hypothetical protein PKJ36_02920, partial [Flavihumibacter sp.]|nr:hypothetical protein [Flavihumibacter sp.]